MSTRPWRDPVDPVVSGGQSLRDQLLGAWSRADDEKNEIYTFAADGRIEVRDFSSPLGATVATHHSQQRGCGSLPEPTPWWATC